MSKELRTYTRIDSSVINDIRLLPLNVLHGIKERSQPGLTSRVFIAGRSEYPPGVPLQLDITAPDSVCYRLHGLAEWTNDGTIDGHETGTAVRILEILRTGAGTPARPSSRDADGSDAEAEEPEETEAGSGGSAADIDYGNSVLPETQSIGDLFESLLDMKVKMGKGAPVVIDPEKPTAVCTFNLDDGRIKAIWISDLPMVIHMGAALSVIPPENAKINISQMEIPDNIRENFQEVLNVSASLFNKADGPHLSLGSLVITPDPIPEEISMLVAGASVRADLSAAIPGYGEGRMSLIETDAE